MKTLATDRRPQERGSHKSEQRRESPSAEPDCCNGPMVPDILLFWDKAALNAAFKLWLWKAPYLNPDGHCWSKHEWHKGTWLPGIFPSGAPITSSEYAKPSVPFTGNGLEGLNCLGLFVNESSQLNATSQNPAHRNLLIPTAALAPLLGTGLDPTTATQFLPRGLQNNSPFN